MKLTRINKNCPHLYGGIFLYANSGTNSQSCREIASRRIFKNNAKEFATGFNENLINIIKEIENILKLSESDSTKFYFYKNNDKFIILSNLDKFWSKYAVRRRLFLSIVKACQSYKYCVNVKDLYTTYYFKDKRGEALDRFLDGYTVIRKKNRGGWDDLFNGKSGVNILERE
jgi:hypothetical protein